MTDALYDGLIDMIWHIGSNFLYFGFSTAGAFLIYPFV